MKSHDKPSAYRTEKLTFAAYLVASDKATLLGTEPVKGSNKVLFCLSAKPEPEDVTAFFNGEAFVSALRFSETINTLKSAAYEARRCS